MAGAYSAFITGPIYCSAQIALSQLVFRSKLLNEYSLAAVRTAELPPYFANAPFGEATGLQHVSLPTATAPAAPTELNSAAAARPDTAFEEAASEQVAQKWDVTLPDGAAAASASATEFDARHWHLPAERLLAVHRFHLSATATRLHWCRIALALLMVALAFSSALLFTFFPHNVKYSIIV